MSHTNFLSVLHIERQYDYVNQLEDKLSDYSTGQAFTREGRHYMQNKRQFSNWTRAIFWYLFPLLYIIFLLLWLMCLFTVSKAPLLYIIVVSMITTVIFISLVLYILALIKKK